MRTWVNYNIVVQILQDEVERERELRALGRRRHDAQEASVKRG